VGEPHSLRVRLPRATPSGEEHNPIGAASLFLPTGRRAANLGTEVHALFEGIEWVDPQIPGAADNATSVGSPEALAHFQAALALPAIRAALSRPSPRAQAFRERSFEVILDGRWVTGTFDRLVVDFDAAGNPVSAEIQDYKTSRIQGPEDLARNLDTYRPQMAMYRKAAARLLGLPEDHVKSRLLFTASGDVVAV
jgi:ATP-dependent exoDNAse (exonuclease V) beta subunit